MVLAEKGDFTKMTHFQLGETELSPYKTLSFDFREEPANTDIWNDLDGFK